METSACDPLLRGRSIIRKRMIDEDKSLRKRFKILDKQDFIGFLILVTVIGAIGATAGLYLHQVIPWWVASLLIAFWMSLAHELEHDLIHDLYFAGHRGMQQAMLTVIWIVKFHSNPFWRKAVHMRHHAYSGQAEDWEERLLGLGDRLGLRRILVMLLPFGQFVYFKEIAKTDPQFKAAHPFFANIIPATLYHSLLGLSLVSVAAPEVAGSFLGSTGVDIARSILILWLLPAAIRYTALTLATLLCHYAADIDPEVVEQENQIVYHGLTLPLALLTANFAATHILHHFYAPQPFYIRTLIAHRVIPVMIQQGCRYNDLAILVRANRYTENCEKNYGFHSKHRTT